MFNALRSVSTRFSASGYERLGDTDALGDIALEPHDYDWERPPRRFRRCRLGAVLLLVVGILVGVIVTLILLLRERPDTDPLPWRAYCSIPSISRPPGAVPGIQPDLRNLLTEFPPDNLEKLPPVGLFIGILTMDKNAERRAMIRDTFASHPKSRNGAGAGDNGEGTSRTIIRFILGEPKPEWREKIQQESECKPHSILCAAF